MAARWGISTIGGVAFIVVATCLTGPAGAQGAKCTEEDTPPSERIEACTAFLASAESPQTMAVALVFRGDAYRAFGEPDRAVEDYEEAIRRMPESQVPFLSPSQAVLRRGQTLADEGEYGLALELFELLARFSASDTHLMDILDIYVDGPEFRISQDGRTLEFSGGIGIGAAREFERVLAAHPTIRRVRLDSEGGYVAAGHRMAQTIKRLDLDTVVLDDCMSACTGLFLAGGERIIGPKARIGFHRAGFPGTETSHDHIARQVARLRREDLSKAFARRVVQTKPADMWLPSHAELLKEKVATRVGGSSEVETSRDWRRSGRELKGTEFLFERADRAYSAGRFDQAFRIFEVILRHDPHDTDALSHRAAILLDRDDLVRAFIDLDALVRLDPQSAWALVKRGATRMLMNDLENALEDLDEALRLDPLSSVAHLSRGFAYALREEYDKAIEDFDAVLRLVPDHSWAIAGRLLAQADLGDYDQALQGLSRLMQLRQDAFAFYVRGNFYWMKDESTQAMADFDHAIRLDPTYSAAWLDRCWLKLELGQFEAALSDCDEALRLDPKDLEIRFLRGVVRLKLGAFDEAIADFDAILQYDYAKQGRALYARGLARLKKGESSGGNADLAAGLAKRPSLLDELSDYELCAP